MDDVLADYGASATPALIAGYDALPPEQIYAPVRDFLPPAPARIADIGAGTGRDAAWFAGQGHQVLAVEPVRAFREAGIARHGDRIEWLDDQLPALPRLQSHGPFDLVLLCAVWHHLDTAGRARAMPTLAQATAPGGQLILSLRHDPAPGRGTFPAPPQETIDLAQAAGFDLAHRAEAESVHAESRAAGVRWTWLMLTKRPRARPARPAIGPLPKHVRLTLRCLFSGGESIMFRNLTIAVACGLLASTGAQAQTDAAASVAQFSNTACYALASGAVTLRVNDPDGLARAIKTVESFGLEFGAPNDITSHGPAVTTMVSRATLGSKTLPDGQVIFADGGVTGCRILLLADPKPGLTDAVAAGLIAGGTWRAIPEMTMTRGAIERRAFIRRDKTGAPYLLNLMTVIGQPGKLRLFTTVARIPPGVTIPAGY